MGMPVVVEISGGSAGAMLFERVFSYLEYVDRKFSVFKQDSETTRINRGEISMEDCSGDMSEILALAERTKLESNGYFDIVTPSGSIDPSGIVKGWAIRRAADILSQAGVANYYVYAGGDIQTRGEKGPNRPWTVGIQHPFDPKRVVKVVKLRGEGIATSGCYARGNHIYNPLEPGAPASELVSITVIGPDVYEADRFATPAFAMGNSGIDFIDGVPGLEGYAIDRNGTATMTRGFGKYVDAT